ncbi:hypothetical protein S7711_01288 [Stachybotrys chartarum IBT 7711]|uniref:CSC1/OSCA1-like 7TM region domain-containing protein n=1 Tax=Stachybotrys chartarum (strain CBS 109288 / IBT 7711) TaxID=1280523 RepID=A0A084BBL0_STACB|nr:hypothetical protein S7711_01288 [Stachybotrys chartarum IBT 7711]
MGDSLMAMDAKSQGSTSLAAVLSAFVPTWATGMAFIAVFVLIRQRFPKSYYPRTYMGTIPEKHRTPQDNLSSYFGWVKTMYSLSDKFILYHSSLDAFLFLRFLRTIIFLCLVGSFLTWPTLMPVNANGGGSSTQLDRIGIGNVVKNNSYYAHAALAWVFFTFVMFTIARERLWLICLRQAWTLSKNSSSRLSSRTILFLSAPEAALEQSNMKRIFGEGAVRIWPAIDSTNLSSLVSDRDYSVEQLEVAETRLITRALKQIKKKQGNSQQSSEWSSYESLPQQVRDRIRPRHHAGRAMTGEKVDSIRWYRQRINESVSEVERARQERHGVDGGGSAAVFVEFKNHADAQQAAQQVISPGILELTPRYLGVAPTEVIWKNLFLSPERRISQEGVATALVLALIVFWSLPSALVGLLSNISYLADNLDWLAWLNTLPDPVMGVLSGLLPPMISSLLNSYVPNIFRFIFKTCGGATTTVNELKVQKWFYIFQVTQVFLVTAVFSSGATVFSEILRRARNPSTIPRLLAKELPKSSNYYLTYFLIQGITASADNILNWSDLLQYLVLGWAFDKTPRQMFNRYTSMKGIASGKVFPKFANFAVIAIAYSCIAPLVLGFATTGLALYYVSYRYNLLFVIQPKIDTRGSAYTLALQHLLTGVYIAELALIGLFGLASATGPLILMVVLFGLTVLYNLMTNRYLEPLEKHLPTDLATQLENDEAAPLLGSAEQGDSHIRHWGRQAHVPRKILDPFERFFEPRFFATHQAIQRWIREGDEDFEEEATTYSDEELAKAYMNPALTSSTPIVWLPRDDVGVSRNEIAENKEAGIMATDGGAWVDEKTRLRWNDGDFKDVPLLNKGVNY